MQRISYELKTINEIARLLNLVKCTGYEEATNLLMIKQLIESGSVYEDDEEKVGE
jgi:hypothetical protein